MVAITTPAPSYTAPRHTAPRHDPRQRALHDVPATGGEFAARRRVASAAAAALAVVVLLALAYLTLSAPMTPGATGAPATLADHVVVEGETMWSIAQDIAPAGESATYVERLVAANGGASIVPGQVLTVPEP